MNLFVKNETSQLKTVILGIGIDKGELRGINPSIREHLAKGTFPTEEDICKEISSFEKVLKENGVEVLRPDNIKEVEQIFTRDIGFVIDDFFCVSKMRHESRTHEFEGIKSLLATIDENKIIEFPEEAIIEGGDIVLWNEYVFVGLGDRTNQAGLEFLKEKFPHKKVVGLEIVVDQDSADKNILHLDCAFQPIGTDEAIIYLEGFQSPPTPILDLFNDEKLIKVNMKQKNLMFPNIFSISPQKIVVERNFNELKSKLIERGYEVLEVDYSETSKLSGLLRCSTLPLRRKG